MLTRSPHAIGNRRPPTRAEIGWIAWHSKVRIAVLTLALFMALC